MNKPQLFCFTYAGGNAAFFDEIEKDIPNIEFVKPEYPGHGTRRKEISYNDFSLLADEMFRIIKEQYRGGDYALFGYSMGTITLIEVLKRILESGMNKPVCVFLAAHEPYTKAELSGYGRDEFDEKIKQRTIAFGAVPQQLIENKSFWRMYLPIYRADYMMISKYKFENLMLKFEIPATVFYSETDTPFADMRGWKNIFVKHCGFYNFEGNHFFIREHHKKIADIIEKLISDMR